MIPQEKIAAATRGLSEAFGVAAFDDLRPGILLEDVDPILVM